MALTIDVATDGRVELADFLDHVAHDIDLRDPDGLEASAPALRALANNRSLMADRVNEELAVLQDFSAFQEGNSYAAQTLMLGSGDGFIVRANLWLPRADTEVERESQRNMSAYQLPHDHDFSFLTVGYFGAGYGTEIWEYDPARTAGYIGEEVELTFLEHTMLGEGKVMLYREARDIHSQEYPDEPSVSLNLLLVPDQGPRPQYVFDPAGGRITGIVANRAETRTSLCRLAAVVGDDRTAERLDSLAVAHPIPRVRWVACDALASLRPTDAPAVLARAADDRDRLVRTEARRRLDDAVGVAPVP